MSPTDVELKMEQFIIMIVVIGGVLGIVIFSIIIAKKREQARREALEKFAADLSLDFHPMGHETLASRINAFKLFNSGHGRHMSNVILGETELVNVAIFDYRYTTGSGKHQHTHRQTVVAMESPELEIPSFTLRPEMLFDWFGSIMGFQDIDFDDHPQFSKMFVLKGDNEEAIRRFFDSELLDFFASRKGIAFEGAPGKFIYFKGGKTTRPEDMREYLEEGYSVYSAFVARLKRERT